MAGVSTEQFMQRVVTFIERFEATLPEPVQQVDWANTYAARWTVEGQQGHLRPLKVSLTLRLVVLRLPASSATLNLILALAYAHRLSVYSFNNRFALPLSTSS